MGQGQRQGIHLKGIAAIKPEMMRLSPEGSGGSGVQSWICLEGREQEILTEWAQSERERGITNEVKVLNNWQDAVAIACDEGRQAWGVGTE